MKLAAVSTTMLRQAVEIYMRYAYPTAEPPYNVRAKAAVDESDDLSELLESDRFEKMVAPEAGIVTRYMLRLGNERYPHMKFGLVSCAGGEDDYVFMVETHDRHFHIDPDMPGAAEFRELQLYNDRIKREVEREWEEEGLPTLRHVLQGYTGASCQLKQEEKTVMVVEDEESIAELERVILECDGYKVVVALSGEDAIEAAAKNHIDLCLLDIMMPDADGFDVIRILKEKHLKHFPVIFVTAMPEARVDPKVADGFIAKPFEPQFLLEKVRSYIG